MPQGLQVWGADGSLVVDVTSRLTKVLGQTSTGISNGSINVPTLSGNVPWFFAFSGNSDPFLTPPTVTLQGNLLSWQHNPAIPPDQRVGVVIFYGVR